MEIKPFLGDGDYVTYWGFSTFITRAENIAIRSIINFLKFNHNFFIEDDNVENMQITIEFRQTRECLQRITSRIHGPKEETQQN